MSRPWMPLYVSDFLADTLDLRAEETGCYLLLLMLAWRRDGSIPDDMKWLRRALASCVSDMHGNRFNKVVPSLLERYFYQDEAGNYRNKRLEKEREKSEKFSEKQKENAEKRWRDHKENNKIEDATALPACAKQSQSQSQDNTEIHDHPLDGRSASPQLSEVPSALRKTKRAKVKTRIDEDAQPSERDRAAADEAGLTAEMFRTEWRKFRDHHRAEGSLKLDWAAAWRYWLGNVQKYQPRATARAGPRSFPEKRSNVAQAIEELHGEFFGQDWRPSSGGGTGNLIEFNELDYTRSD